MRLKIAVLGVVSLSLAMGAVFLFPGPVNAQNSALEQERAALQQELAELESQIDEYGKELDNRRGEISNLKNQIAVINAQIAKLNAEIKKTENEITIKRLNIRETKIAIDRASADVEVKKAILAELLRSMYILSGESMIEQLLRYQSLSEALAKAHYASDVQQKVNVALNETRELRQTLTVHEGELGRQKGELEVKNRELGVQKTAQASERSYKDTILTQTKQEEKRYQDLLSQAEQEKADFLRRLAQIEEQIKISQNFLSYFKAGEIPPKGTKIFLWPQGNPKVTQGYGYTKFANRGAYGGQGHNGVDMSAGLASPVRAAAGGTIAAKGDRACIDYANRSCNGYWGNWVAIEHPGGLVTLYAHLTRPAHKAVGAAVEAGEIIGYEGATGNITGPHLHFTVYTEFFTYKDPKTGETRFSYNYGKTLNPLDYL